MVIPGSEYRYLHVGKRSDVEVMFECLPPTYPWVFNSTYLIQPAHLKLAVAHTPWGLEITASEGYKVSPTTARITNIARPPNLGSR